MNSDEQVLFDEAIDRATKAEAACAEMRQVFQLDSPYPLPSVLTILRDSARHLLHDHDCDCLGHEKIQLQEENVRVILRQIEHALSTDCGKGWVSPDDYAKEREHWTTQAGNWEARADKCKAQLAIAVEALEGMQSYIEMLGDCESTYTTVSSMIQDTLTKLKGQP